MFSQSTTHSHIHTHTVVFTTDAVYTAVSTSCPPSPSPLSASSWHQTTPLAAAISSSSPSFHANLQLALHHHFSSNNTCPPQNNPLSLSYIACACVNLFSAHEHIPQYACAKIRRLCAHAQKTLLQVYISTGTTSTHRIWPDRGLVKMNIGISMKLIILPK